MKNCLWSISCAALVLVAGCDFTRDDEPVTPLLPLEVGNRWVMAWTGDLHGRSLEGLDTLTVAADTLIDGERWFRVEHAQRQSARPFGGAYYANRDDGLWKRSRTRQGEYVTRLVLPYPYEEGYSFEVTAGTTVRLAAGGVPVETEGAGVVTSYLYEQTISRLDMGYTLVDLAEPLTQQDYFSPDLGFVRFECYWVWYDEGGKLEEVGHERWSLHAFLPAQDGG